MAERFWKQYLALPSSHIESEGMHIKSMIHIHRNFSSW